MGSRFVVVNKYWDKATKFIILFIDAGLNLYFLHTVNARLVRNIGLKKYRSLVSFNIKLMVVSVLMDVSLALLIHSIPSPFLHFALYLPALFLSR
jgi:hypothetical protein